MIFGQLFCKCSTPSEFLINFSKTHTVVGGIFANGISFPDILVIKNISTEQYYCLENFALPRRTHCRLPISVFETNSTVTSLTSFKKEPIFEQHV